MNMNFQKRMALFSAVVCLVMLVVGCRGALPGMTSATKQMFGHAFDMDTGNNDIWKSVGTAGRLKAADEKRSWYVHYWIVSVHYYIESTIIAQRVLKSGYFVTQL